MPSDLSTRPLNNKTAWITGAGRGIGLATAHALGQAGAHVILGARSMNQIEDAAEAIRSSGGTADAISLDVAERDSCEEFAARAHEKAGHPSFLINNAGIGTFRPVQHFQEEEFEQQFRVNVFGTYYMTRIVVPLMQELGGGHIVNVSSLAGEHQAKMGTGYFATKHAVNGFTKCLMLDVRDMGIRVTLVCPGSVDTRFHVDSHPGSHQKDQSWMLSPKEVADAIMHALTAPCETLVSKIDIRPSKTS